MSLQCIGDDSECFWFWCSSCVFVCVCVCVSLEGVSIVLEVRCFIHFTAYMQLYALPVSLPGPCVTALQSCKDFGENKLQRRRPHQQQQRVM